MDAQQQNATVAANLRRRMTGTFLWGLLVLALGVVGGASVLTAVFLIPHKPAQVVCSVAGAFQVFGGLAGFGLALLQRGGWQRSLALAAVADDLGLAFEEDGATHLLGCWRRLEMFSAPNGQRALQWTLGRRWGLDGHHRRLHRSRREKG